MLGHLLGRHDLAQCIGHRARASAQYLSTAETFGFLVLGLEAYIKLGYRVFFAWLGREGNDKIFHDAMIAPLCLLRVATTTLSPGQPEI